MKDFIWTLAFFTCIIATATILTEIGELVSFYQWNGYAAIGFMMVILLTCMTITSNALTFIDKKL